MVSAEPVEELEESGEEPGDGEPRTIQDVIDMELERLKAHPNCQWATWNNGYRFQVKKRGHEAQYLGGMKGVTKKIKHDDIPGLQQLMHTVTSSFLESLDAPEDEDLDAPEMPGEGAHDMPGEDADQDGYEMIGENADPGNPHGAADEDE